jgi:hypothetical protein
LGILVTRDQSNPILAGGPRLVQTCAGNDRGCLSINTCCSVRYWVQGTKSGATRGSSGHSSRTTALPSPAGWRGAGNRVAQIDAENPAMNCSCRALGEERSSRCISPLSASSRHTVSPDQEFWG